jgi:hypothetical protein
MTGRSEPPVGSPIEPAPLQPSSALTPDPDAVTSSTTAPPVASAALPLEAKTYKNYDEQLKDEFNTMFQSLTSLTPQQRFFLKSRWLDQVLWMEKKSVTCRDRNSQLRRITIIGGVIVPILVTLNTATIAQPYKDALRYSSIALSGIVAISSAMEEFYNYGKRWYSYRRSAESLKSQGWHFFELTGPYRSYPSHKDAFGVFVEQVEGIIERDVEQYVTQQSSQQSQSAVKEQVRLAEKTGEPDSL